MDIYERLGGPVAPPLKVYIPPDLFRAPLVPASFSTSPPRFFDPDALLAQIAVGGVRCEACRMALHQLAGRLSATLAEQG